MAYTTDQVEALERAIATGTRIVRNANGEYLEYRDLGEMQRTLAMMKTAMLAPANRGPRVGKVRFVRD